MCYYLSPLPVAHSLVKFACYLSRLPSRCLSLRPESDDVVDEQYFTAKTHYDLLFDIISSEVTPQIEQMNDLLRNQGMSFDYVWALLELVLRYILRFRAKTGCIC